MQDTMWPGFAEECRRQGLVVAKADLADQDLLEAMNVALADADEFVSLNDIERSL